MFVPVCDVILLNVKMKANKNTLLGSSVSETSHFD